MLLLSSLAARQFPAKIAKSHILWDFAIIGGMNRQLIFIIGIALVVLPWPQIALPYVVKLIVIGLFGLVLIFQAMKQSVRTNQTTEKK